MDTAKKWNEFVDTTHEMASDAIDSTKDMAAKATRSRAGKAAQDVTDRVERVLAERPTNAVLRAVCLAAAGAAAIASLGMFVFQRKHESLYIGQWVLALLIVALWGQAVRRD